jgi:hypothetical protein
MKKDAVIVSIMIIAVITIFMGGVEFWSGNGGQIHNNLAAADSASTIMPENKFVTTINEAVTRNTLATNTRTNQYASSSPANTSSIAVSRNTSTSTTSAMNTTAVKSSVPASSTAKEIPPIIFIAPSGTKILQTQNTGGVAVSEAADIQLSTPVITTTSASILPKETPGEAATSAIPTSIPIIPSTPHLTIPYTEKSFAGDPNWQRTWGHAEVGSSGFLEIGANPTSTGGGAYLLGSSGWDNYLFVATIDWMKGSTFTLIADDSGGGNDVKCVFDNGGDISIYRSWSNGDDQLIGHENPQNLTISGDTQAFIQVDGDHVHCGIGKGVASSYLSSQSTGGGIGFDAWDPNRNNSEVIVKSISVTPSQDSY